VLGGGGLSADNPPRYAGAAGHSARRGGNAESVGVGDWFAQQVDQRVVDARVLDPSRSEEKLHDGGSSE
jgi:hypothetical protein